MGPLLMPDKYLRDTKEEKDPKKHKREHPQENQTGTTDVATLVRLMGSILLRLDHRQSTDEKARLLRFLSSNSRTCLVAPLDVESEGMAHPDEAEDTGNGGAAAIHSSEDGPFSGPGDHDGGTE